MNRQGIPSAGLRNNRQALIQNGSEISNNGKLSTLISLYGNHSANIPSKKYSMNIENGAFQHAQLSPTNKNREMALNRALAFMPPMIPKKNRENESAAKV